MDDAATAWGIQLADRQREAGSVWLWPEHVEAFDLFKACETQWRVIAGMAGAFQQGIDYTALEAVMRMRGVEYQPTRLAQVQMLERGALDVINA